MPSTLVSHLVCTSYMTIHEVDTLISSRISEGKNEFWEMLSNLPKVAEHQEVELDLNAGNLILESLLLNNN